MTLERAREIVGQLVQAGTWFEFGGEPAEAPDCSLAEMVEANRLVREAGATDNGNGTRTLHCHCDDRLTAALYALKHYGNDPHRLLEAVGFRLASQ